MTPFESQKLEDCLRKIEELEDRLKEFKPVVVDLRINGVVRPLTLFALDANHKLNPTPFQIVK